MIPLRLWPALIPALALAAGEGPARNEHPLQDGAGLALIGLEPFDYPDGPLDKQSDETWFDADNAIADDPFIGHDGTSSTWLDVKGAPFIKDGRLITDSNATRRPLNGPSATEEEHGAIVKDRTCKVLYFRVTMNRSTTATWSGVTLYDHGAGKLLFGVPDLGKATDTVCIEETGSGTSEGSLELDDDKDHELIGKLDTTTGLASLWVDPNLTLPEAFNAPAVTRVISGSYSIGSLGLGSQGKTQWDDFRVTTTWNALGDGPPVAKADAITLHRGQKVRVAVLANDSGPYDSQHLEIVKQPASGTAIVQPDHSVLYTHNGGEGKTDSFVYRTNSLVEEGTHSDMRVTLTLTDQLRVPASTLKLPPTPPPSTYVTVNAFPGVSFKHPTGTARIANDGKRLFVTERSGKIWLIPDVTAKAPTRQLFLDLAAVVNARSGETFADDFNERGLKSVAFHPDYLHNGRFFVAYCLTIGGVNHVRLSSFQAAAIGSVADAKSEKPLITQVHRDTVHNINTALFGPDGYLYFSCGDEGPQNDANDNGQHIDKNFWSAVFRIDVDRKPGSLEPNPHPAIAIDKTTKRARYTIPPDNPFIGTTTFNGAAIDPAKVRTEIYATGFRNPWRLHFDPLTHELWTGDVGWDTMEEIDRVVKGGNYEWGFREGTHALERTPPPEFKGIPPVYAYNHGSGPYQGSSVIAGMVLRGGRYPDLEGRHLFSDYVSGNIWVLQYQEGSTPVVERIAGQAGIVAYDIDPSNDDVLMVDISGGRILRLVPSSDDTTFPDRLSKTGLFADLTDLSPNPGLVAYDVNLPFWSDHAKKRRWFAMPTPGSQVGFHAVGNWTLPTGALWVKHFDMEMERGNSSTAKRLETRILVKTESGAYGVSYRWNDEGTDAFLVPDAGVSFPLSIKDNGATVQQTWTIPSRAQCMTCHTPAAGHALSFETRQLNRTTSNGGTKTNFLTMLHDAGYLDQAPPSKLPRHIAPDETAYSLEARARSWLSVNCSYCHRPDGSGAGTFDLRGHLSLYDTGMIEGTVSNTANDSANRLIVRGDSDHSAILSRMSASNGYTRMPPLGSGVIDQAGIDVVREWIMQELPGGSTYDDWRSSKHRPLLTGDPVSDPEMDDEDPSLIPEAGDRFFPFHVDE